MRLRDPTITRANNQFPEADLIEKFEVQLDEGLDTFVVVDGCPQIPEESKPKLIKVLAKRLGEAGRIKMDGIHMPVDEATGKTFG